LDVARLAGIGKLFQEVATKFGKIDVLFVNTGVFKAAPLTETSEGLYDKIFGINAKGAFFTIQKAAHFNDGASILLNTSVMGERGMAGRGIRVNAVAPPPIDTPMFERTGWPKEQLEGLAKMILETAPMKRFGKPEEVAAAVIFLASSDASYITGEEINVDGGMGQI
jgi:NAD(P)-dependent dehydrogenase (short-subunit alcohol dehydrogenase family)